MPTNKLRIQIFLFSNVRNLTYKYCITTIFPDVRNIQFKQNSTIVFAVVNALHEFFHQLTSKK